MKISPELEADLLRAGHPTTSKNRHEVREAIRSGYQFYDLSSGAQKSTLQADYSVAVLSSSVPSWEAAPDDVGNVALALCPRLLLIAHDGLWTGGQLTVKGVDSDGVERVEVFDVSGTDSFYSEFAYTKITSVDVTNSATLTNLTVAISEWIPLPGALAGSCWGFALTADLFQLAFQPVTFKDSGTKYVSLGDWAEATDVPRVFASLY